MANVAFTKLGLKINKEVKTISYNDQEIEIKQYLPVNEKLDMISRIINYSVDEMKFYNIGKLELFMALEVIFTYTNVRCTDKQKEDPCKLYDTFISSGFYDIIIKEIPESELEWIEETMMETVEALYKYHNSVMGLIDTIQQDYSSLDFDATAIQEKIANPENLTLLKDIMTKLG